MNNYYNSKEIAEKCGLHLKTVQKFMREGKLTATKVGREWRVSSHELSKFMEGEHCHSISLENYQGKNVNRHKFDCKAIIEVAVRDFDEASSYSNMIIGALNSENNSYLRSDFEFMYYDKERKAKLVFSGDALFIADMMLSINDLEENQNE